MIQRVLGGTGLLLFALTVFAAHNVVSAVEGTVNRVDARTKTIAVKTTDGAEHTFHFVGRTAVHGTSATVKGSKDAFHGLKKGSEVAVHYTAKGGLRGTLEQIESHLSEVRVGCRILRPRIRICSQLGRYSKPSTA